QVWRQLEEQRTQLWTQGSCDPAETVHPLRAVLQPAVVRDAPRPLQRQLVGVWRLSRPSSHQFLVGHAVERVVDLDGRKSSGVVGQHLGSRQIRRIEAAFPLWI